MPYHEKKYIVISPFYMTFVEEDNQIPILIPFVSPNYIYFDGKSKITTIKLYLILFHCTIFKH